MNPLCPECTPETPCGGHHIYVIELDISVTESGKFMKKNPQYDTAKGMACFYVGSTHHSVRCRFNQHLLFDDPECSSFQCDCFGPTETRYFRGRSPPGKKGRTTGNSFVGKYHKYLRGRMFRNENPFPTMKDAETREEQLALELRANGFGAWYGVRKK